MHVKWNVREALGVIGVLHPVHQPGHTGTGPPYLLLAGVEPI